MPFLPDNTLRLTEPMFQYRLFRPLMLVILITFTSPVAAQTYQSHQSISSAVRSFLSQHIDSTSRHEIIIGKLDVRLRLRACNRELGTFFGSGGHAFGNTTVGVNCQKPNPWTIFIPVQVKIYKSVLATQRPLTRNSIIQSSDLRHIERDVTTLRLGYFTLPQHVIGKVTKRPLPVAAIFTPASIQAPRLITRGDKVTILVKSKGLQVRAIGKALMDGKADQQIKVKNMASKKVIEGIVSAPGVVTVGM